MKEITTSIMITIIAALISVLFFSMAHATNGKVAWDGCHKSGDSRHWHEPGTRTIGGDCSKETKNYIKDFAFDLQVALPGLCEAIPKVQPKECGVLKTRFNQETSWYGAGKIAQEAINKGCWP